MKDVLKTCLPQIRKLISEARANPDLYDPARDVLWAIRGDSKVAWMVPTLKKVASETSCGMSPRSDLARVIRTLDQAAAEHVARVPEKARYYLLVTSPEGTFYWCVEDSIESGEWPDPVNWNLVEVPDPAPCKICGSVEDCAHSTQGVKSADRKSLN